MNQLPEVPTAEVEENKSKGPKVDFEQIANKFQKKLSKSINILDCEYKTAFFHPNQEDVIVIFKSMKYPADCNIIEYKFQFQENDEEEHKLQSANKQMFSFTRKKTKMGCITEFDYQKEAEIVNKRIETGEELGRASASIDKSGENKGRRNYKELGFNYDKIPFYQVSQKSESLKYNYGITFWKCNKGQNPMPFREYGMNWKPMLDSIFVSRCGQYLFYIIGENVEKENQEDEEDMKIPAKWVVILDINTLEEVKIYELPECEEYPDYRKLLYSAALCWGASTLFLQLYLEETDIYVAMFINLAGKKVEWVFNDEYEDQSGGADDIISWTLSSEIIISEKNRNQVYILASDDDESSKFYLFRVNYKQNPSSLFTKRSSIWSKDTEDQFSDANTVVLWYNKNLTQLALADNDSLGVMQFKGEGFEQGNNYLQYMEVTADSRDFQQNHFLSNNLIFGYQQGTVTTIYDVSKTSYCQVSRLDTNYDGSLNDYKLLNNQYVLTMGLRNNKGHIFENEMVTGSRINIKCMPVGKVKDNKAENFEANQKNVEKAITGKIQESITEISKLNLLIAKKDEIGSMVDYILVCQNKTNLYFLSLIYGPIMTLSNLCKGIKFIHKMEINNQQQVDQIFILVNSGIGSIQIQRVYFSGKEGKETLYDCYSLKTINPRLFRFHNNRFFVLQENLQLIRLELDQGTQKMENQKFFLFSDYDIDQALRQQQVKYDVDAMMVLSDYSFYWNTMVFNLNEQSKINKDKDFFQYEEFIPSSKCIIQGPDKIKNPDFLLYVVKDLCFEYDEDDQNDSDYDEDEEAKEGLDIKEDEIDLKSGRKDDVGIKFKETNKEKNSEDATTKVDDKQNILDLQQQNNYNPERSITEFDKNLGVYDNDQKQAIYQGEETSTISLLLTIPIDQNYMQFLHNDSPIEGKQIHEQNIISFSTFIQDRSRVLIMIQGIFLVFNKYGSFCCYVDIFDEKKQQQDYLYFKQNHMEDIIQMSDNCRFYLLYNRMMKTYNVFEFTKTGKNSYSMSMCKAPFKLPFARVNKKSNFNTFTLDNWGKVTYIRVQQSSNNLNNTPSSHVEEFKEKDFEGMIESEPLNSSHKCTFKIYKDDKDVTSQYQPYWSQFQLINSYLQEQPSVECNKNEHFGAVNIGGYLIVKYYTEIEYMKIFCEDQSQRDQKPTKVDLTINNSSNIQFIYATGKESLVQFIIRNDPEDLIHVLTWDLEKNMEYAQVQLDIDYEDTHPEYRIVKGMNTKYNYYCAQHYFYDFQFFYPMKFLKSHQPDNDTKYKEMNVNQRNVSFDCSEFLDLSSKNTIIYSKNMQNLYYFKQLKNLDKTERDSSKIILLHFRARIDTQTLFHIANMQIFQDELKLMQLLLDEVQKAEADELDVQQNRESLLNILYPNKKGKSAFDLCMKRRSQKMIEVYLKMLIELDEVKHYRFSKFIRKHFDALLEMGIKVFFEYLKMATFRLQDMQKSKKLSWPHEENLILMQSHTSYIGQDFYSKLQKKQFNAVEYFNQGVKLKEVGSISQELGPVEEKKEEQLDIMTIYDTLSADSKEKSDEKKVEIWGLEFEWIFTGPLAAKFVEQLAEIDGDDIFDVETIKYVILYQWSKFFPKIFTRLFIPFIIYFVFFNIYVTLIYEMNTLYPRRLFGLDVAFAIVNLVFVIGFSLIEFRQLVQDPLDYVSSFWNWIDILAVTLNLTFIIGDLGNLDPQKQRMIGASCVIVFWLKFYYFLRLFKPTAKFIAMMMQIMADIKAFGFFLTLAFLMFTNTYYVMAFQGYDIEQGPSSLFSGADFIRSIPYSYLNGLGDFHYDAFDSLKYGQFLWVIWFFEVILVTLTLLNLLIALLTSSFQGVKELEDKPYLKGVCSLMQDNEILLNRQKEFGNAKFVIIAKIEQGESEETNDEEKIKELKQQFKQIIQNQQEETTQMNTDLNLELMEEIKQCKQKIENAINEMKVDIVNFVEDLGGGSPRKK